MVALAFVEVTNSQPDLALPAMNAHCQNCSRERQCSHEVGDGRASSLRLERTLGGFRASVVPAFLFASDFASATFPGVLPPLLPLRASTSDRAWCRTPTPLR